MAELNDKITVCDECFRACCWQGIFMCDRASGAGTTQKTKKELLKLALEHSDYMLTDNELSNQ